jgi:hypothetical protein
MQCELQYVAPFSSHMFVLRITYIGLLVQSKPICRPRISCIMTLFSSGNVAPRLPATPSIARNPLLAQPRWTSWLLSLWRPHIIHFFIRPHSRPYNRFFNNLLIHVPSTPLPIPTASSSKQSNGLSVKGKVGISLGVFVFVGAAVMGLWLIRRKFRERRSKAAAADTSPTRVEWSSGIGR